MDSALRGDKGDTENGGSDDGTIGGAGFNPDSSERFLAGKHPARMRNPTVCLTTGSSHPGTRFPDIPCCTSGTDSCPHRFTSMTEFI